MLEAGGLDGLLNLFRVEEARWEGWVIIFCSCSCFSFFFPGRWGCCCG